MYAKLHKIPISNISVHIQLLKKSNGYHPFLFNISVNFCYVMRKLQKNPLVNIAFKILAKDSNINHTCPYDHDIIIRRLVIGDEIFKILPNVLPQVFLNLSLLSQAHFKFTNFKCIELDKSFLTIPICKLKLIQRGVVAMELHFKLHKIPVNNVTIHVQLFKKAPDYRPFLYNISANLCQVLRNSQNFPLMNIFIKLLAKHSNINHTCPYNEDIFIKHLIIKDEMLNLLPMPQGEYLVTAKVGTYNEWKASVKVYFIYYYLFNCLLIYLNKTKKI
ncbi:hypothetical protein FF38_03128 [Lucilia cuprina]|uniref:Uncharacterized protein n=1 Tax=Lucilia cuprina TaxID=7375 RepID=A0A0L0C637_LUCCU|nr:hypothetical protein FF38_03128 [Lucilia cuprina]